MDLIRARKISENIIIILYLASLFFWFKDNITSFRKIQLTPLPFFIFLYWPWALEYLPVLKREITSYFTFQ